MWVAAFEGSTVRSDISSRPTKFDLQPPASSCKPSPAASRAAPLTIRRGVDTRRRYRRISSARTAIARRGVPVRGRKKVARALPGGTERASPNCASGRFAPDLAYQYPIARRQTAPRGTIYSFMSRIIANWRGGCAGGRQNPGKKSGCHLPALAARGHARTIAAKLDHASTRLGRSSLKVTMYVEGMMSSIGCGCTIGCREEACELEVQPPIQVCMTRFRHARRHGAFIIMSPVHSSRPRRTPAAPAAPASTRGGPGPLLLGGRPQPGPRARLRARLRLLGVIALDSFDWLGAQSWRRKKISNSTFLATVHRVS